MRTRTTNRLPGPSVGTFSLVVTLAAERHNGAKLSDLSEQQRLDLYAEAEAMRARYLQQ